MKRMQILCAVLACLFLSGCITLHYHKRTTLRIKGGKIKVPWGSIAPVEGEDVQATLTREVHFIFPTTRDNISALSDVAISEESNSKGGIDIKK